MRVRADQMPALVDRIVRDVRLAIVKGAIAGAHRGRSLIAKRTPKDLGQLRDAWKVVEGQNPPGQVVATLLNDAPYAGVVETGARPHPVSREGVENIRGWVLRKFGLGAQARRLERRAGSSVGTTAAAGAEGALHLDRVVEGIVWGIVTKLKTRGQRPTYFVRKALPSLQGAAQQEVRRAVDEAVKPRAP